MLLLRLTLTVVMAVGMWWVAAKYYRHSLAHPEKFQEGMTQGAHLRAAVMLWVLSVGVASYVIWFRLAS